MIRSEPTLAEIYGAAIQSIRERLRGREPRLTNILGRSILYLRRLYNGPYTRLTFKGVPAILITEFRRITYARGVNEKHIITILLAAYVFDDEFQRTVNEAAGFMFADRYGWLETYRRILAYKRYGIIRGEAHKALINAVLRAHTATRPVNHE